MNGHESGLGLGADARPVAPMTADTDGGPTRPPESGLGERSRWIDLDGPLHYLDFGGPADGPVVVCVHGLGGSAANWSAIAPKLADRCRLLAPDLAGHGLTQSMGRGTDVAANRVLLHRFIESVAGGGPVLLMGNSMGGMISLLEAASAADTVAGLVLVAPALPFVATRPDPVVAALFAGYAMPGLSRLLMERRRRLSPERLVAETMSLCCVDASRVPAEVIAEHVVLARLRASFIDLNRDFVASARSVVATAGRVRGGSYRQAIRSVTAPVLIVQGERDRLVPLAAVRAAARANPAWSLAVLDDVGHVPQLEKPQETAKVIIDWLDSAGRPAVAAATIR